MNCPNDIADILIQILGRGVLYARFAGWHGDAKRAALEADHVHNLPALLLKFSDANLWYYFHLERPSYISAVERYSSTDGFQMDTLATFRQLWERLEPFVPAERPPREGKSMAQIAHEFAAERDRVE